MCAIDKYLLAGEGCVDASTCTEVKGRLLYETDDKSERLCIVRKSKCTEKEGYVLKEQCLTEY